MGFASSTRKFSLKVLSQWDSLTGTKVRKRTVYNFSKSIKQHLVPKWVQMQTVLKIILHQRQRTSFHVDRSLEYRALTHSFSRAYSVKVYQPLPIVVSWNQPKCKARSVKKSNYDCCRSQVLEIDVGSAESVGEGLPGQSLATLKASSLDQGSGCTRTCHWWLALHLVYKSMVWVLVSIPTCIHASTKFISLEVSTMSTK